MRVDSCRLFESGDRRIDPAVVLENQALIVERSRGFRGGDGSRRPARFAFASPRPRERIERVGAAQAGREREEGCIPHPLVVRIPDRARASGLVDGAGDLVEMGDVHLQGQSFSAHGLNLAHQITGGVDVAKAERYIGTGVGQPQGNGAT